VRELIENYKKEIEELKVMKGQGLDKKESKYAVSKIEVLVGLDESFDDAYIAKFNNWLADRVKSDYGSIAIAATSKIKLKEEKPIPPQAESWRDFLPIIPYLLLGLCILFAAYFLAKGLRRLGEGSKTIVIESSNPIALNQAISEDKIADAEEEKSHPENEVPQIERAKVLNDSNQLVGKIAFLCLELGKLVNELVRVWLTTGKEGYMKTAILVDTIVSIREKIRIENGVLPALQVPLDSDLSASYEENLAEAYRQTPQMTEDEREEYLEKIYWDLISIKTLGIQSLRRPFDCNL
jgi:hypothetical protein